MDSWSHSPEVARVIESINDNVKSFNTQYSTYRRWGSFETFAINTTSTLNMIDRLTTSLIENLENTHNVDRKLRNLRKKVTDNIFAIRTSKDPKEKLAELFSL